jgi:thiol-disulfide isomerase/thioredoxin
MADPVAAEAVDFVVMCFGHASAPSGHARRHDFSDRRPPMPSLSSRCLAALSILLGSAAALPAAELTIGSPAPAIDVEHWLQDGEGKYKPVTEFKKDKVYVVEFWATWCGPCIMSMPHIAQMQADYADKDVQVISISDEDLETVKEFLERDNGEGETFADVTKGYCLTTDPDKSVYADYMEAAGQNGIPTAFIVGNTGEIEWIGHPMEMDGPLAEIVDGSWDRAVYAEEMAEMQKINEAFAEIRMLLQADKGDEAAEMVDGMIAGAKNPRVKQRLEQVRGQLDQVRLQMAIQGGGEKAAAAFSKLAEAQADSAEGLNALAWMIVTLAERGAPIDDALTAAATEAAEKAAKLDPENGPVLDTLAHLYAMQGEVKKAIAAQRKAVALGGPMEEPMKAYLEELEAKAGK